jgi:phosphatidylinositol 4-kinase
VALLRDALARAGLPLYLAPYGVLPTAYECGIIEVRGCVGLPLNFCGSC